MRDQELLAAIGQVMVNAAVLEYSVAVLVAVIEGQGEERANDLAAKPGDSVRALCELARQRPARRDLDNACRGAQAALADRGVLAHSLAFEYLDDDGQASYVIWHPKQRAEMPVTVPQVLSLAQALRIAARRMRELTDAETTAQ